MNNIRFNHIYLDLNDLNFYHFMDNEIIKNLYKLSKHSNDSETYNKLTRDISNFYLNLKDPMAPTVWKNFILSLILEDSTLNQFIEKNDNFDFLNNLESELESISVIYNIDFSEIVNYFNKSRKEFDNIFNKNIYNVNSNLGIALEEKDPKNIYKVLKETIKKDGLGLYRLNKVFKIKESDNSINLEPIKVTNIKKLDELVEYNSQKEKLIQNTRSFINGTGGLNTLLYGEMGTGKSTMVKSLIDYFKDTPLRFIDTKKTDIKNLPEVINLISKTNYPFIIFIDDLGFESDDDNFRALKSVLEGSFESLPDNILIYATANKRTLINQSKSEREDAVNAREILEEKLSLVSRFGLTIPFTTPNQKLYLQIVEDLAKKNNIPYDDDLKNEALQWELRHMNRSGRTAEQFIQYKLSELSN